MFDTIGKQKKRKKNKAVLVQKQPDNSRIR